jgi:hypothetical protein
VFLVAGSTNHPDADSSAADARIDCSADFETIADLNCDSTS